ncbi:MAG: carboxypeptidase-like regulatory domain-containing protein [Acidobacteria bacterium]|nr:carboxypeptidase-like regulatory domain-containing protein [Acidobacteriota bacterium]MCI0721751.1 carboxypeptidase-like regulatory domain-containing protein [Acidobacteriota bacterium]
MKKSRSWVYLLVLFLVSSTVAPVSTSGQELVGSRLFGTVTDASGAVIPAAEVRITSPATGFSRTVQTGEDGTYLALQILGGIYHLEVTKAGFKTMTVTGVVVRVNENARQNVQLEVGEITTRVEVSSQAALVNTYTSDLTQTIDSRRVVDLPLNARDVTSLSMLSVGTTDPVQTTFYASSSGFAATAPSVNGSKIQDNSYFLDGVSNIYSQRLTSNLNPNPDAIEEFTFNMAQYSAEFGGRPGGQLSARTKSGTNELHGTLFEFVRNPTFNARRWEDTRGVNDGIKRHQYGWAIGGPVYIPGLFDGRNKLFWFNSYQRIPVRALGFPGFHEGFTAKEKAGDFSEHLKGTTKQVPSPACNGTLLAVDTGAIFDPRTANSACGSLGSPFPGNIIPASMLDPVAQRVLRDHTATSAFVGQQIPHFSPEKGAEYQILQKVDLNLGKHGLMFRYLKGRNKGEAFNDPKDLWWSSGGAADSRAESFAVTDTWSARPNLVTTAGFVYIRNPWSIAPHPNLVGPDQWGSRITADADCRQLRALFVQGRGRIGFEDICGLRRNRNWEFNASTKWIKGKHEIGFGGIYGKFLVSDLLEGDGGRRTYGQWDFTGGFTGLGAADFVIGRMTTFVANSFVPNYQGGPTLRHVANLYVHDNIRLSRRLTLNLGLRWEPGLPSQRGIPDVSWVYPGQKSQRFPNAPVDILYGGDPGTPGTGLFFRRYGQLAPRIGFALDPTGSGKWAIRGGIGSYFGIINGGGQSLEAAGRNSPPMAGSRVTVVNPPNMTWPWDAAPYNGREGVPLPPATATSPVATPFGGFLSDPFTKGPNTWQWSLTIERSLRNNLLVRAGYVRTRGVHLQDGYNYNLATFIPGASTTANIQQRRPNPNLTAVHIGTGFGDSWYNAFQLTVEKRYAQGLSFLASYTLSKSIDTNSTNIGWAGGFGTQDPRGPAFNRGLSDFDRTHVLSFAPIWDLPKLSGANPVARAIFGNWQMTSIVQLRSGHTLTPTTSGPGCLCGPAAGTQRADLVPGVDSQVSGRDRPEYKSVGYFNQAAFKPAAEGTFGAGGRNTIRGPGYANTDFMVAKIIPIREKGVRQICG